MEVKSYTAGQDCRKVDIETNRGRLAVFGIAENIMRCVYTCREEILPVSPLGIECAGGQELSVWEKKGSFYVSSGRLQVRICRETGSFTWEDPETGKIFFREGEKELTEKPLLVYTTGGEEAVIERYQSVDGERSIVANLKPETDHMVYSGRLNFQWASGEQIHGLGQGEEGIYDYRGKVQYLYQHNMRIPVPFLVSDQKYGVLTDCGSLMTFNDDERGSYLYLDAVEQMDYYVIAGKDTDEIIRGFRKLTGKAVMLPKWSFGYVQSKEAYHGQKELVAAAAEYRRRKVGLDCIVQDWKTWKEDEWGNKRVDRSRYPDLGEMRRELHGMHVHSMVSVWPNMNEGTDDYEEMKEHGFLLNDYSTYDAFSAEARELYWKQAERELFSGGFDAWWCDSSEPFTGSDWSGEYQREPWERYELVGNEHRKYCRADRANLYPVYHARGMYENQRKAVPDQRVLNLTRSGYPSSQKYGTMLWSGDTSATWQVFRRQVTEGLNMCISGMPYWTLDIGGFFTVHEKWWKRGCGREADSSPNWFWRGDYEEGTADAGYRELYVRWFEYGAFLPMFRSHGTDTPREIWNFGETGDPFYDALVMTIETRYRLMPYIYSLAGNVWLEDGTMLRSLLFDFPEDRKAAAMDSEFMFGSSLLVCPVTEPMYYGRNSEELKRPKRWSCYLPEGAGWYDFYTGEQYEGGRTVDVPVDLSHIPVFVKAGSVLPMEQRLEYAQEEVSTPLELRVYPGADGSFVYYEDGGDGYEYEGGKYNRIVMEWQDTAGKLTIGGAKHKFPQGILGRKCVVTAGRERKEFLYEGRPVTLEFKAGGIGDEIQG